MKNLRDYLLGPDWPLDPSTGLFLPPGTRHDELYMVEGGPRHKSNPGPFYFVKREPVVPDRVEVTPVSMGTCGQDGCDRTDTHLEYRYNAEADETEAGIYCLEHGAELLRKLKIETSKPASALTDFLGWDPAGPSRSKPAWWDDTFGS